ncbi:PucR family transcriptional regulator [Paenibacillus glycanilyticus]|uniref:Purine catabolism regulatory protein n=1 Tax=Paenibacillus glycanilyticus TaxID=126569 RepID=A0ABQ6GD53_9BACL|nr:PucR family transcriptional regulator [Paenibacillus glycanilyticus]GLX67203.1 purine catabolism regulatory protein [Paenibacillus glycanilyticus]
MLLTVEDAMRVFPLSEGKLIAGKAGGLRPLKAVNIIDAPDFVQWAKEGDMFFTTAYVFKDSVEEAIATIRSLHQRQSAGLGIKLGRFWSEMPAALIEEADSLGFPLIELPYPFAFSDQINGLLQEEINRSTLWLKRVVEKQKRLMNVALYQSKTDNPFQRISAVMEYPMAIVGGRGHILYNDTACSEGELMSEWPWKAEPRRMTRNNRQFYRLPLMQEDEGIGFAIFVLPAEYMPKSEEGLFHQASEMLAYYLSKMMENGSDTYWHQELGTMINHYLDEGTSLDTVLHQAEKAGVHVLENKFVCVLCAAEENRDYLLQPARLKGVRQELEFNPAIRDKRGYHVLTDAGLLSIYPVSGTGTVQAIASALEAVSPKDGQLRFAFSTPKDSAIHLAEAYGECKETIKLSRKLYAQEKILHFDTIQMAHLFQYVPGDSMRQYCRHVLGPLIDSDTAQAQDMLQTLDAYVTNEGLLGDTAKHLYVHRNTVSYRLEKLSELLGLDFKKPNDFMKLRLAILFLRMMD